MVEAIGGLVGFLGVAAFAFGCWGWKSRRPHAWKYLVGGLATMAAGGAVLPRDRPGETRTLSDASDAVGVRAAANAVPAVSRADFLPGLTSGDLKMWLGRLDLRCGDMHVGQTDASWVCESEGPRTSLRVELVGKPARIEYITATVSQLGANGDDEIVARLLKPLARLPYEGASPDAAEAWVNPANISKGAEAQWGVGKFRFSGPARARSLDIKARDSKY